jgi:hypothetical protein
MPPNISSGRFGMWSAFLLETEEDRHDEHGITDGSRR